MGKQGGHVKIVSFNPGLGIASQACLYVKVSGVVFIHAGFYKVHHAFDCHLGTFAACVKKCIRGVNCFRLLSLKLKMLRIAVIAHSTWIAAFPQIVQLPQTW